MYWLGHLGYTSLLGNYFVYTARKRNDTVDSKQIHSLQLLLIGSLFPDFIDKPLNTMFGLSGRGYGHSLLFTVIMYLLVKTFLTRSSALESYYGSSFAWYFPVGMLFHLLEDNPFQDPDLVRGIFFPLKGWVLLDTPFNYLFGFQSPYTIITEITGATFLFFSLKYQNWGKQEKQVLTSFILIYLSTYILVLYVLVLS